MASVPALAADPPNASEEASSEEIVVVGSRGAPRLLADSPAPVDVISAEKLGAMGFSDVSKALQFLVPSLNFARTATGPSAANTRAITLRGLSPDQVLVLVNGKRRHASSVMNFNNVVGRGSVPVDLNTIPLAAVERVEILRDGAAAQYGSDAIAGVINIVLRSDASGGGAEAQLGATEDGDGETGRLAVGRGMTLGERGFLTLSGEVRYRDSTNGATIDSRFGRITNRQGDPESTDVALVANSAVPLESGVELYGNVIAATRNSQSAAQYRAPDVSPLYPQGFLPLIELEMKDAETTLGGRGTLGSWNWDVSNTLGYNRADFSVSESVNTSLGASSPTSFDAGGSRYLQNVVGLSLSRQVETFLSGLTVAAGIEHRYEQFEIVAGAASSFVGAGAQGFPGFNPPTTVDEDRSALSGYVDLEVSPVERLDVGAAVRHEDYSDFGRKTTGKLSTLFRASSILNLRATASTGFRAPSLQQQFFSTVTSQSSAGVLVNVGTFAAGDPVSLALGGEPLKPETSEQYSAGAVLTVKELTFSADAFRIDIADRIILSESLSGAAVASVLAAAGISNAAQVRFFTNAADTRTQGYELTGAWKHAFGNGARLDLIAGYMSIDTDLERLKVNPVLPTLPLLGLASIDLLTAAQPDDKVTLNARLSTPRWEAAAQIVRFGSSRSVPVLQEQTFSPVTTLDVTLGYRFTDAIQLVAGVLNATDAYPDKVLERGLTQGGSLQYTETGGLGTEGREYFVRLGMRL